jgi:hypothetical protein
MIGLMMAAALGAGAGDVAKLEWLAGTWTQTRGETVVRETWLAPKEGGMGGVGQTTRPGRPARIEFMKITAEPAGATFTAVVDGQPPTPFVLLPGEDGEAVFENKTHDFPQRVFYRRCGEELCAGIEGTVKGELKRQEWRYTRVR